MNNDDSNWRDHRDELFERVVRHGRARKRRRGFGVATVVLAIVLALAAGLYLPDRGTHTLHVSNIDHGTTTLPPARSGGVLLIGDSVMLGAKAAIENAIPEAHVDAAVSRQFDDAIAVVNAAKRRGALPPTIVIHLGVNGPSEGDVYTKITTEFTSIMNTIGTEPEVYFLTVKVPRTWEGNVNSALYAEAGVFPNSHVLAWHDFSRSHSDWFLNDQFHLTRVGQAAYAATIRDGIRAPQANGGSADAATYAYEHFFDPALTAGQRANLIQGGDELRAFIDQSFAAHAAEAAAGEIVVDRITVHGTTADVSFHALYHGRESPANPGEIEGTAVLEDDTWKIGRVTYCTLSANDGELCPPTASASSEFAIVLDDTGLHVPQAGRPAATYTVSFADRRSDRGDQRVALVMLPGGPDIILLSLPAGARRTVVLLANLRVQVVINGVRQRDLSESLNIDTSEEYPTPAT